LLGENKRVKYIKFMSNNFIDFVFKFFTDLRDNSISLVYDGEINHNVIRAFTELTHNELELKDESNPIKKKVFNVMVESLQNISKHAERIDYDKQKYGRGIILISENNNYYNVTTGNIIKKENKKNISENIDVVNSKNKAELRELFKTRLSTGRLSEKGGAGLGFIDIAKKSGNSLEYHFEKMYDEYYFFILNSQISKISNHGKN